MSQVKLELVIDASNPSQVEALNSFLRVLGGNVSATQEAPVKNIFAEKNQKAAAKKVEDVKVEAPQDVSPAAEATKEETTKESGIKIEDVRALLSKKVANHRDAIKEKLTALDANNVTSLDKKHYQAFNDFLNSLS